MTSGVFKGGDGATAPLFGLALNFWIFLRCFCKLRFVIEPRKIRVLSSHCPYFCLLETASECTQTYHFGGQKWFFFCGGVNPPLLRPTPLGAWRLATLLKSTSLVMTCNLKWKLAFCAVFDEHKGCLLRSGDHRPAIVEAILRQCRHLNTGGVVHGSNCP